MVEAVSFSAETEYERGRALTALVYIAQVKRKISSGEYPTEEISCFCGSHDFTPLTKKDRYGIPYQAVICNECALVRANPRPTASAYAQYYNNEYRKIHFPQRRQEYSQGEEEDEELSLRLQRYKGQALLKELDERAYPQPKIVVDFGCFLGGMLIPFKEQGVEVWGIEIDQCSADKARARGIAVVSTIEELIAKGVKADLVIMQDVIEHLTDLHEVTKVREILSERGLLYVWTPGFFRTDDRRWQLAHTYQFCAHTLEYVMGELGFQEKYLDEDITSFWEYKGDSAYKFPKPSEWVRYTLDEAFNREYRVAPPFRGVCKFKKKELYSNADINLAKGVSDLSELVNKYSGPIAIIGGGPSVDTEVENIKNLKCPVMAIARMYPWCMKNGIQPDFVIALDSMEEQEKGFTSLCKDTKHLVAAVARPSLFNKLQGFPLYIWASIDDPEMKGLQAKHGYERAVVINTGGSVTVACLSLAMFLGFRSLHVFGSDCMVKSVEQTHSKGIAGVNVDSDWFEADVGGEKIITSTSFLEFARQSIDIAVAGKDEGLLSDITFHGESLINKLWDGKFPE